MQGSPVEHSKQYDQDQCEYTDSLNNGIDSIVYDDIDNFYSP